MPTSSLALSSGLPGASPGGLQLDLSGVSSANVSKCTEQPRARSTMSSSMFCPDAGKDDDRLAGDTAHVVPGRAVRSLYQVLDFLDVDHRNELLSGPGRDSFVRCSRADCSAIKQPMATDAEWRAWVHAALVGDLSAHLGARRNNRARTVATDIGNQGFVWTLEYYTKPVPKAVVALCARGVSSLPAEKFVTHRAPRACAGLDVACLYSRGKAQPRSSPTTPPRRLQPGTCYTPGATSKSSVSCSSEASRTAPTFAEDNTWVSNRVKRRAARRSTVQRPHGGQRGPGRSAPE